MDRSKALGEDKISVLLWRFSLPAIVGMLVNALYNIIDSIFVGNGVGAIGLTAVTIAFPVMIILMAFGMLIGIGAAAIVSIRIGEKDLAGAEKILGNAFILCIVFSVVFTVVTLPFLDWILVVLGAEPDVLPYARDFTEIIILGSIFMYIGFGLNNIIRAEGNPKVAMTIMLISAVVNAALNPLFIFIFKMGIAGSALATVIAQAVSAAWVLWYFLGGQSMLKLRKENFPLEMGIMASIFEIGLSPFLMQVAASVVTVIYNYNLIQYGGDIAVASIGVINRISMIVLMPIFGINQGVQPIIGYNFGARNYKRVIEALKIAVIAATGIASVGFILAELFAPQIVRIFNANQELIVMGSTGLRIILLMLPVIGFQIVGASYFQAVGKAGKAILLSMSRQVILLIPLILILPNYWGLNGVWAAGPIADFLSALLTGLYLMYEVRNLARVKEAT